MGPPSNSGHRTREHPKEGVGSQALLSKKAFLREANKWSTEGRNLKRIQWEKYEGMTHNVLKIQKEIQGRQENETLGLKLIFFITVGEIHKYINKPHSAFICQRNFSFRKGVG